MNYEFFFVKHAPRRPPRLIRVYSPAPFDADLLLAEHFGYRGARDKRSVRAFLRSADICRTPVLTLFPKRRAPVELAS